MNLKNLAMWAIIVFLTIGLYNMFKNPQTKVRSGNQIIFSEFLTSVDNGEVVRVELQGNNINGVLVPAFFIILSVFSLAMPSVLCTLKSSFLGMYEAAQTSLLVELEPTRFGL